MSDRTIPRDVNVCFWCKYADHSYPACRRRAPAPVAISDGDEETYRVDWPYIDLAHDWCGEFEAGTCMDTHVRTPQDDDREVLGEMGWGERPNCLYEILEKGT